MAPQGWVTDMTQKTFLDEQGVQDQLAAENNTKGAFFEKLYHNYFNIYHWSLQDTDEPVPGMLYTVPTAFKEIAKKEAIILKKKQVWMV
jgi:hypothetical protein